MTKTAKKAKVKTSRLTSELLSTADDFRKSGMITKAAHDKITMRHISVPAATTVRMSGSEIKALREKNHISQAVFATYLQVTADFVSKLERDETKPTGPTLVLLNVIRRKGLEAIL